MTNEFGIELNHIIVEAIIEWTIYKLKEIVSYYDRINRKANQIQIPWAKHITSEYLNYFTRDYFKSILMIVYGLGEAIGRKINIWVGSHLEQFKTSIRIRLVPYTDASLNNSF